MQFTFRLPSTIKPIQIVTEYSMKFQKHSSFQDLALRHIVETHRNLPLCLPVMDVTSYPKKFRIPLKNSADKFYINFFASRAKSGIYLFNNTDKVADHQIENIITADDRVGDSLRLLLPSNFKVHKSEGQSPIFNPKWEQMICEMLWRLGCIPVNNQGEPDPLFVNQNPPPFTRISDLSTDITSRMLLEEGTDVHYQDEQSITYKSPTIYPDLPVLSVHHKLIKDAFDSENENAVKDLLEDHPILDKYCYEYLQTWMAHCIANSNDRVLVYTTLGFNLWIKKLQNRWYLDIELFEGALDSNASFANKLNYLASSYNAGDYTPKISETKHILTYIGDWRRFINENVINVIEMIISTTNDDKWFVGPMLDLSARKYIVNNISNFLNKSQSGMDFIQSSASSIVDIREIGNEQRKSAMHIACMLVNAHKYEVQPYQSIDYKFVYDTLKSGYMDTSYLRKIFQVTIPQTLELLSLHLTRTSNVQHFDFNSAFREHFVALPIINNEHPTRTLRTIIDMSSCTPQHVYIDLGDIFTSLSRVEGWQKLFIKSYPILSILTSLYSKGNPRRLNLNLDGMNELVRKNIYVIILRALNKVVHIQPIPSQRSVQGNQNNDQIVYQTTIVDDSSD